MAEEEGGPATEYNHRRQEREKDYRPLSEDAISGIEFRLPYFEGRRIIGIELKDELPLIWNNVYEFSRIPAAIRVADGGVFPNAFIDARYTIHGGSGEEST